MRIFSDFLAKVSRQGWRYRDIVEIRHLLRRCNVGSLYLLLRWRISQRQGLQDILYFIYVILHFILSWSNQFNTSSQSYSSFPIFLALLKYLKTFKWLLHSKSNSDEVDKFLSLILFAVFFFRANRLAMQRTNRSGITWHLPIVGLYYLWY